MTPETKQEKKRAELEENLLILSILATEMEKYGYAVKGNINEAFAFRVDKLLEATKIFLKYVNAYVDEDTLADVGEAVSKMIKKQLNK